MTADMNENPLKVYTVAEVEAAIAQMHPLKSPGSDGFAACFYQKSWTTVKSVVRMADLDFVNKRIFDNDINATNIALIPKTKIRAISQFIVQLV